MRKKTSVPEQALLFYIQKYVAPDAVNNSVYVGKYCADVVFTHHSELYDIEYDSYSRHNGREVFDEKRNRVFIENGYKVIRMRDRGLDFIPNCTCIRFDFQDYRPRSIERANEGINELLSFLGVEQRVDIAQDLEAIRKRYAEYQD